MQPTQAEAKPTVPPQALLLSLLALAIPVVISSLFPEWTNEDVGTLIWILALIPPFLLSYYRGWGGASLALAGAMAAFTTAQVIVLLIGANPPSVTLMVMLLAALISVTLGSGWIAGRFRKLLAESQRLAFVDAGTDLPNRRRALLHLERAFGAANRGELLSVVLFDVDHFKRVNDTKGHAAGDAVLREFGRVLKETTRQMNLSARYGGEEFLSILDGVNAEGAIVFAERVRAKLRARTEDMGGITASAGIAQYEPAFGSPEDLVEAADKALYSAKDAGRDRVHVLNPTRPVPESREDRERAAAGLRGTRE